MTHRAPPADVLPIRSRFFFCGDVAQKELHVVHRGVEAELRGEEGQDPAVAPGQQVRLLPGQDVHQVDMAEGHRIHAGGRRHVRLAEVSKHEVKEIEGVHAFKETGVRTHDDGHSKAPRGGGDGRRVLRGDAVHESQRPVEERQEVDHRVLPIAGVDRAPQVYSAV